MKPLESLFATQAKAIEEHRRASREPSQLAAYIRFDTSCGAYAVPITAVREVVDSFTVTPYPEPVPGHVGIVSLRGQVLPVIAPKLAGCADETAQERLLVLEFTEGEPFCVCASRVQKVLVERRSDVGLDDVVNIQSKPVRLLREAEFFKDGEP